MAKGLTSYQHMPAWDQASMRLKYRLQVHDTQDFALHEVSTRHETFLQLDDAVKSSTHGVWIRA